MQKRFLIVMALSLFSSKGYCGDTSKSYGDYGYMSDKEVEGLDKTKIQNFKSEDFIWPNSEPITINSKDDKSPEVKRESNFKQ